MVLTFEFRLLMCISLKRKTGTFLVNRLIRVATYIGTWSKFHVANFMEQISYFIFHLVRKYPDFSY